MFKYKFLSGYPVWPLIASFLLLSIIANISHHGIKELYAYKKSVNESFPLSLENIHFFTREYLYRQYLKLSSPSSLQGDITEFYIFSDESSFETLNEALPMSGKKQFVSGHMRINQPNATLENNKIAEFSSRIDFRYRGGLPLHWNYEKKSFRIKLPDYTTYNGEQNFNLVVPSTVQTIVDLISYNMSRSLGILTPDYYPAEVFINNKSNGLHYYLSRMDESFLRKNKRMPGSIYSGDTINIDDPFNTGHSKEEITFTDMEGISILWKDARLWSKQASRNSERQKDRSDINHFIRIVNSPDPVFFMNQFHTYFDTDTYFQYLALDTLFGNFHHDLYHNHKIYFDPYKGKFEPIEWDVRIWSNLPAKDIVEYPLLKQIILNPLLDFERDKALFELLSRFSVENVTNMILDTSKVISPLVERDALRNAPASFISDTKLSKTTPFSFQLHTMSVNEMIEVNKFRHRLLDHILNTSDISVEYKVLNNNSVKLTLTIDGNSPFEFNPHSIISASHKDTAVIKRLYKNKFTPIPSGSSEIIYPGRKTVKGNATGMSDPWVKRTFGDTRSISSPLKYDFIYENINTEALMSNKQISGLNAITGDKLVAKATSPGKDTSLTESIHPWSIYPDAFSEPETVRLSGTIRLDKDLVFSTNQNVTISPGTSFLLCKRCSIFFYGGVIANGTSIKPITFQRLTKDHAWGSIVIQGQHSSNSSLNHINVNGGSITSRNLIHYTGQFNIHDTNNFSINNSQFSYNSTGDDSLHIAYSNGTINNTNFTNSAFDALDIDISPVKITNSNFTNSGNDAIDLMASEVSAHNISIKIANDKCISVGEQSRFSLASSTLSSCLTGIAVKDGSSADISSISFNDFKQKAIHLYQKNTRFDRGGTISGENLSGLTLDDIKAGKNSKNLITTDNLLN